MDVVDDLIQALIDAQAEGLLELVDDLIRQLVVASVQQQVDATYKRPQVLCRINGVITPLLDMTTRYSVNDPIGTATLEVGLPLPGHIREGAPVTIDAGYEGLTFRIFEGSVPKRRRVLSLSERAGVVYAQSSGHVLARQDWVDVRYPGPITMRQLFQGMCHRRKVPSFYADEIVYPNGTTPITLATNAGVNEGAVLVQRKTGNLGFLTAAARLFGARVFDSAQGMRLQQLVGVPTAAAALAVREGVNAVEVTHEEDASQIVNYWEVFGATPEDSDGGKIPIRSIPQMVPPDPRVEPDGWSRGELSGELLDTYALADAARNFAEIERRQPWRIVTWETHGAPHLLPGDVIDVRADAVGVSGKYWLTAVQHSWTLAGGLRTRSECWRGDGAPLPAGSDCVTVPIPGGPWHIGDEYIPWYAVPSPNGTVVTVPFTVTENFSAIVIRGLAHGTNSYILGTDNTESDVSKFELWQAGEQVGSGPLPVLNEDYTMERPYGSDDRYWSPIAVPVSGQLEPGPAELRIISGTDDRAGGGPIDDMEIKSLSATTCGIGEPVMPEELIDALAGVIGGA